MRYRNNALSYLYTAIQYSFDLSHGIVSSSVLWSVVWPPFFSTYLWGFAPYKSTTIINAASRHDPINGSNNRARESCGETARDWRLTSYGSFGTRYPLVFLVGKKTETIASPLPSRGLSSSDRCNWTNAVWLRFVLSWLIWQSIALLSPTKLYERKPVLQGKH